MCVCQRVCVFTEFNVIVLSVSTGCNIITQSFICFLYEHLSAAVQYVVTPKVIIANKYFVVYGSR